MEIKINEFGIAPDTGAEAGFAFAKAIAACRAAEAADDAVLLTLTPGVYDFYHENAIKKTYFISNTASETEAPDKTKHIGLLFDHTRRVTLDGGGSLLRFHGKFTQIVFDGAEQVTVKNLRTDFARPTMSEMELVKKGDDCCEFLVREDSPFEIRDGAPVWVGPGFEYTGGPTQIWSGAAGRTWRCPALAPTRAQRCGADVLRLYGAQTSNARVGDVFQIRNGIRDEVGIFALSSKDIALENVTAHYMHGLGFVGQFSENITLDRFCAVPNAARGRTNACFADSVHISGCKGRLVIRDCVFDGLHDDALNVHGTYLAVQEMPSPHILRVRFRHPQTYGFPAFFPGDELRLVRGDSLHPICRRGVRAAEMLSPREMLLSLDEGVPDMWGSECVVENVTWQPEVLFEGNTIRYVPTRGVLLGSRKKTVVRGNLFERTGMSAILTSGDACEWFESSGVEDLLIENNRFVECGAPVIRIWPHVDADLPHEYLNRGVCIRDNAFTLSEEPYLEAWSVRGVSACRNDLKRNAAWARIGHCSEVDLDD